MTTRINSDTLLVQDGISEKLSMFIQNISTFLTGFIVAFTTSVTLTAVLVGTVPLLVAAIAVTTRFSAHFSTLALNYYSYAGAVAEEVISSMRTVLSFGTEKKMVDRFEAQLKKAEKVGIYKGMADGVSLGTIYFIIYLSYALGFWYGGQLVYQGRMYAGDVLNVFFCVLISSFSLGNSAPDVAAFSYAIGLCLLCFSPSFTSLPFRLTFTDL